MSPYKNFLSATKAFFESNGFLNFLLTIYIGVFAFGGVLFILGEFLFLDFLTCPGIVLMLAGLILTLIKEDMMALLITSASISILSLIVWILAVAGALVGAFGMHVSVFVFTPLFYFAAFGAIALVVFLKADKFKQMREETASRNQMTGVACPRCGGFVPLSAGFCPTCGAPKPVMQEPPVQPQYAPPAPPQYAPPVQPQYAPPVPPQYAPPAAPQYAPPAAPQPEPAVASEPVSAPEEASAPKCVSCGADISQGAAFCPHCGAKQ